MTSWSYHHCGCVFHQQHTFPIIHVSWAEVHDSGSSPQEAIQDHPGKNPLNMQIVSGSRVYSGFYLR